MWYCGHSTCHFGLIAGFGLHVSACGQREILNSDLLEIQCTSMLKFTLIFNAIYVWLISPKIKIILARRIASCF